MLIAHATYTHITRPEAPLMGVVEIAAALERAVVTLNRLDPLPDLVIPTGISSKTAKPKNITVSHTAQIGDRPGLYRYSKPAILEA